MKNIIQWFVLLLHRDMQNFEMDGDTNRVVYNEIMNHTKNDGETKQQNG